MPFSKQIICLANSIKLGSRCVAGKELQGGRIGEWIRPVSKLPTGELSLYDIRFEGGGIPQLLDVVSVTFLQHKPHTYQSENYLIDDGYYWVRESALSPSVLPKVCDAVDTLWLDGYSSYSGLNDRIPQVIAENQISSSLLLIETQTLSIIVAEELGSKKVRAEFTFGQQSYRLMVTDPLVRQKYLVGNSGIFRIDREKSYLCISLGETYQGYCYKLVAGIFPMP